ncbi:MAG TPA: GNAT family protein [Lentimicrobium sp.]|nr:GNAT family protein [Lentimicrobium sp.]
MNITLGSWKPEDIDLLVKYADNKKIADKLTDAFPHPYTRNDGLAFIRKISSDIPQKVFAIMVDGEPVGSIGIFQKEDVHRKNAEIGYWLAEPFWGRGIIVQAIKLIVEYGKNTFDINRIYAVPFSNNPASQRVLEKAGFTLEATLKKALYKNGEYLDELIYSILFV